MRTRVFLRGTIITLVIFAFALVLTACGGGKHKVPGLPDMSTAQPVAQAPTEVSLDDALAELDAYPAPDGVDAALFAQLKDELAKQLNAKGVSKIVSTPPTGEANRVDDLELIDNGNGSYTLTWSYRNVGDYDQDGIVGISDITPIAIHYNEEVPEEDKELRNSIQAVVDGSENGVVDIADITPIAMNYGCEIAGYSVQEADNPAGPFTELLWVPFGDDIDDGWLRLSVLLPAPPSNSYRVVPVDSVGAGGVVSRVAQLAVELEGPPDEPINANIPDATFPEPYVDDFIFVGDYFAISYREILIVFKGSTTVQEANETLSRVGGQVTGGLPEAALLLVVVPAKDLNEMMGILESLNADPGVKVAINEMASAPDVIPPHNVTENLWTWEVPDYPNGPANNGNWGHKLIRAPQMWNLDTYVRRNRAGNQISAGVIESGFDASHIDLGKLQVPEGIPVSDHGTMVAGIIGATWDNNQGVEGIDAWIDAIQGRECVFFWELSTWGRQIELILELLGDDASIRAVNNSYGVSSLYSKYEIDPAAWNFGDLNGDNDNDDPGEWGPVDLDNNGVDDKWAEVVGHYGELYNDAVNSFMTEVRSDFFLVASAGNAGAAYNAVDNSPIANAAVRFGGPFLAVESIDWTNTASGFSDIGGSVSAPGQSIRSTEADDGTNYDESSNVGWWVRWRDGPGTGNPTDNDYATNSGTSFSAPYVTGLIAALWKLKPDLNVAQIRTLITDPDYSVPTSGGTKPRIDAFAAAMGIDVLQGNKLLQKSLVDVDDGTLDGNLRVDPFSGDVIITITTPAGDSRRGDGHITMRDFRAWRDAYLQVNGDDLPWEVSLDGPSTHFKKDLNFDGAIGEVAVSPPHPVDIPVPTALTNVPDENVYPRYDFNGDGEIAYGDEVLFKGEFSTDLEVMVDGDLWQVMEFDGYIENVYASPTSEGTSPGSDNWEPHRYLLANRDVDTSAPAALKSLPDYIHSFDFHIRIDWDTFNPDVDAMEITVESEVWPDGIDNDADEVTDEDFEVTFKRRGVFARETNGNLVVTLPLWTGKARISWQSVDHEEPYPTLPSGEDVFTDLRFGQDEKYTIATAGGDWHASIVDSGEPDGAQVGWGTSLAEVNGCPAISYYDGTYGNLKYTRANDASGSSWNTYTVDSAGDVGWYTSLAIVNGNPAIAYYDYSKGDLKYARANDADGSSWGIRITVDGLDSGVGYDVSLAVVNGNPAISYYDWTNYDLKYVRANDAVGYTWGTPVTVDSTGWVGEYTSLAIVNGNPAISYYDETYYSLKYVRASDADGSSWGSPVTVDSAGLVGWYTSLAVVNGNPAISYYDWNNYNLNYVRASDDNGFSWGSPVTVDFAGDVGEFTSLAIVNGSPAIGYYDDTNHDPKYVRAADMDGSAWGIPETVDSVGDTGWCTSLATINGRPAISYFDYVNYDLKFAPCY
ncbi:S8 family serine peptidase [bacterium]|nr:S8 family serine peptidase [bacterium]